MTRRGNWSKGKGMRNKNRLERGAEVSDLNRK